MINEIKIYNIDPDDSLVYAVSLVDYPAVETNFICLKKDEQEKRFVNLESEDKRMIYGCALRADYPIYRRYGDEEFYITFTKEAIEKLSQKYLKKGFQFNLTKDHEKDINGITITESWLKYDAEKDKSIALGLDDVAVGSWFIGCNVDDDELWNEVKEGKWGGFSIEAEVVLNEIKLEKHNMNTNLENNENFWNKLKETLASFFNKEEKVEEQVEETVELAEEQVEEKPIEEEVPVDPIVEEVVDTVETIDETPEEVKEDLQAIVDGLNAKIAEMEGEISAKDAEIEELKKANTELSAMPSAKQIKVNASHNEDSISFLDYASGRLKLK